ncbi:MAG: hypothetical protein EHM61_19840 [Acidobacteria bacterium]|nr:MAG: hypothetical protein EHM61_19840 [Acidobacteriota bacterium]
MPKDSERLGIYVVVALSVVALAVPAQLQGARQGWVNIGPEQIYAWDLVEGPSNPNQLYIAAGGPGVYRSTAGGWTLATTGLSYSYCEHLAIDPSDPKTVYAAFYLPGFPGWSPDHGFLYKSKDNGWTWSLVASTWGGILQIVADPHIPGRVYASVRRTPGYVIDGDDRPYALLVTAGDNWHSVKYSDSPAAFSVFPHPRMPGVILGVERTESGDTVCKSGDHGESWVRVTKLDTTVSKLAFDSLDEKRIYAASAKGLLISTDGGAAWSTVGSGLGAGPIRSLNVLQDGSLLLWQDQIFQSSDRGETWKSVTEIDSEARSFIPSRSKPGVFYLLAGHTVLKSTNSGEEWNAVTRGLTGYSVDSVAAAPSDPKTIYLVSQVEAPPYDIFVSQDGGGEWAKLGFPSGHATSPIIMVHPEDSNRLYLASSQQISVSTDGAKTWRTTRQSNQEDGWLGGLLVDPRHPDWVYASYNSGLERSEDAGETWKRVSSEVKASSLASHTASGALYAAGESGLRWSKDNGATWQVLKEGKTLSFVIDSTLDPTIYVFDYSWQKLEKSIDGGKTWIRADFGLPSSVGQMVITPENVVYASTSSRGVFRSDNGGASWHPVNLGLGSGRTSELMAQPGDARLMYLGSVVHGLYRFQTVPGSQLAFSALLESETTLTGFAVSNPQPDPSSLQIIARRANGQLVVAEKNPRVIVLGGLQQLALTGQELFGTSSSEPVEGWVEVNGSADRLAGLFMTLGPDQADGAQAARATSSQLCFSRIHHGPEGFLGQQAVTRLFIVNPNNEATECALDLYRGDGTRTGGYFRGVIAPGGLLSGSIEELFGVSSINGGYVVARVNDPESLVGITGFELVELPKAKTRFGLQAADSVFLPDGYSAQVASVSGAQTRIRLVNVSEEKQRVKLQLYAATGALLAPETELELGPRTAFDEMAANLFALPPGQPPIGSLRVIAAGAGILGDVVFGDFQAFERLAALRIESAGLTDATFSQLANGLGYYTGLALFNPSNRATEVSLEAYSAEGNLKGQTVIQLPAFSRISKLLVELIPETVDQVRGWISLRSSHPIAAQELFGTDSLLAAVPAARQE